MLCLMALACAVRPVHAADSRVSYSTWIVSSDTVMLRFVVPVAEADRLTGSAIPVLTVSKLGDYVLEHTAVFASGRECPTIDQGYDLGRVDPVRVGAGNYGFEILFRCGEPMRSLVLENRALFDRVPGHVDFARIQAGRRLTYQLFRAARQRVSVPDPAAARSAGLDEYARLGFTHILRDAGRLCFLAALLLAVRRLRAEWRILGALAVGYALALGADASGLILSQQTMPDAFVGFLVALCALAAVVPQLERPGGVIGGFALVLLAAAVIAAALHAPRPALLLAGCAVLSAGFLAAVRANASPAACGRQRWTLAVPALMFGFLDGFALPSLLAPQRLAGSDRAWMSSGYDLGALIAEAIVLAIVAALMMLANRAAGAAAQIKRPLARCTLAEVLAATLFAGLGTFWLVSRLHA